MDFAVSSAQDTLISEAGGFAGRLAAQFGGDPPMTRDVWKFWGAEGWLGVCVPREYGGRGEDLLSAVLAFEAMGRAGVARSQLFAVGAHLFGCCMALVRHGAEAQRSEWLPRLARGEAIGALAFSEPAGGSDLASCETRLESSEEGYRLNGRKSLVTNGALADLFVMLARMPSAPAPLNVSTLLLGRDSPGLTIDPLEATEGLRHSNQAELAMLGCPVAQADLLGHPGGGMGILLSVMQCERSCILAGFLGALERDLVAVTAHLTERGASGHQAVLHRLATIRTRLETARWLMYRAAWGADRGEKPLLHASMSKLTVSTTLVECTKELAELASGEAWKGRFGLGRALADAIGTLSASGTSHVQLNTIGALLERE
ncbi:MAG: acyl-CoA dehydrogenase family protein [Parasphingopyxis sp.]